MIFISPPFSNYQSCKAEIDQAITRVCDSGTYVSGLEGAAFEAEFATYLGIEHAIGVANGTDALEIALLACGVGIGDEVITVSHTASATVAAILSTGATPILIDIDPSTYTISPERIDAAITQKTKALIAVHLYGHPAAIDEIIAITRGRGLRLIEDCCQAHGATFRGKRVGTFGDVACFSFYPTKNLGGLGDGGIIVTSCEAINRQCRMLKEYGWKERFFSESYGFNSRLDELQAAILRVKLKYLDQWNAKRRALAESYVEALQGLPIALPREKEGAKHVYHQFVIRVSERDALKQHLLERKIPTGIHYPTPIHLQPIHRRCGISGPLSETEKACQEILSLPIYPELSPGTVYDLAAETREFLKGA